MPPVRGYSANVEARARSRAAGLKEAGLTMQPAVISMAQHWVMIPDDEKMFRSLICMDIPMFLSLRLSVGRPV